jgi:hypothetical protein
MVKVFNMKVTSKICWYPQKGLVRRNTRVKYQSPSTYQSKYVSKIKVFNMQVKHQCFGTHEKVPNHSRDMANVKVSADRHAKNYVLQICRYGGIRYANNA